MEMRYIISHYITFVTIKIEFSYGSCWVNEITPHFMLQTVSLRQYKCLELKGLATGQC